MNQPFWKRENMREALLAVVAVVVLLTVRWGLTAYYEYAWFAGYCASEEELYKAWMETPDRIKFSQDKRVNPDFEFRRPPASETE